MVQFGDSSLTALLLFGVALVAGIINGVAGGGGLLVFPTLLFTGIPPIQANATNTASLWFGTVASTFAYRQELTLLRRELVLLTSTSLVGGCLGVYVLLKTPTATFTALIPYLMLTATLIFAFGQPVIRWWRSQFALQTEYRLPFPVALLLQFGIAIYIGFFGGGAGVVILAVLELMGLRNVHVMNAAKTWLASCTNGMATLAFIATQSIYWPQTVVMASGALIGGYGSAYLARQLPQVWVRGFVIGMGSALTLYFFVKGG